MDYAQIPFMRVSREDIKSLHEGKDDFPEWCKRCDEVTDEELCLIADGMSDTMMQNYWDALRQSTFEMKL